MGKVNCVVAQGGGPTAVINGSLYGVIVQAMKRQEIDGIYGAINGVVGVLRENFIDLRKEPQEVIDGLTFTPGAALGSCRYKLTSEEEIGKVIEIFRKYKVRYFFYIGGNDSMDTANRIYEASINAKYDLGVIGIPKTVDNDLLFTDHCPGFGSAAKYIATSVLEAGYHARGLYEFERVTILETVGRNTGWLAGASALARRSSVDPPHLIYFPEVPFSLDQFKEDVKRVCNEIGGAFIVVGEGIRDERGELFSLKNGSSPVDSFGHVFLGRAGDFLRRFIIQEMGLVAQNIKLDICQQSAAHLISGVDIKEAQMVGEDAVKYAVNGKSGVMITLIREEGSSYRCKTSTVELSKVANRERKVPRPWINEEGNFVRKEFIQYAYPLIQEEVKVPTREGLPLYVKLHNYRVKEK